MTIERPDSSDLFVSDVLSTGMETQELAEQMSAEQLYDRISTLDQDIEDSLDQIEALRLKVQSSRLQMNIAQQALKLTRDKGLE